jgi:hypothetical protein
MPLWAAAAYFYYRGAQDPRASGFWALLGLAIGLGMLTKYSTVIFAAIIVIHTLSVRAVRATRLPLLGPCLAMLVCLAGDDAASDLARAQQFSDTALCRESRGPCRGAAAGADAPAFLVAQIATLLPCVRDGRDRRA